MDTPQRGQQHAGTAISRVEDSPVFSYISSLSPIKPVESVHITHALHPLNFSSPPSVFASPHVNSLKEHKLPIRYLSLDSAAPEFSSEELNEKNLSYVIPNLLKLSESGSHEKANCKVECSLNEATADPPEESQKYNCGSPDHNTAPCFSSKADLNRVKVSLVDFACDVGEAAESPANGNSHCKEEVLGCEWENLITDGSVNLLIFDPSTESEGSVECSQKIKGGDDNYSASFSQSISENGIADWQNSHPDEILASCPEDPENPENPDGPPVCQNSQEIGEQFSKTDEEAGDHDFFSYEDECQHQRGFRRRCLVFEAAGPHVMDTPEDQRQSPLKPVSCSNLHVLPSIGLHLNSLATSSKVRIAADENPSSGRKLTSLPCSLTSGRKAPNERDSQEVTTISGEELDSNSPKKKRCKPESSIEPGTCRRCNCKKSKCLKLYCECFAAGVYCVGPCACEGCLNKPIHEDIVLATRKQIESRNPLAFAPKVIRASATSSGIGEEINKTPASARHKRGCNCKKSGCLKKYCECYQGGVGCSVSCRCEGCKNTFGRREGILPMVTEETEPKEEHIELCSDNGVDNDLPVTPSFHIRSSSLLTACHKIQRPVLPKDETPKILREMVPPFGGGVKTSSPNGKRVSPPHHDMGSSPSRKGGRRLILRSIPSFPSLATDLNC